MPTEKELQISPIVNESVMHNTKVSLVYLPGPALTPAPTKGFDIPSSLLTKPTLVVPNIRLSPTSSP